MNNLIIIGARGAGREYCSIIRMRSDYGKQYSIKGFLDDKDDALKDYTGYPPILDSVEHYTVQKHDKFICAVGNPLQRIKYVELIQSKGGQFMTFISDSAVVHPSASIGEGSMIGSYSIISSDVTIGDFNMIQSHCILGHDVRTGHFCSVGSFSFLGGFSSIGDGVALHTRATLLPKVKVGNDAIVGAGSVVIKHVKPNTRVFGVPAKIITY